MTSRMNEKNNIDLKINTKVNLEEKRVEKKNRLTEVHFSQLVMTIIRKL